MSATLPFALQEFINLFNRASFWESHEVLEKPWRDRRSDFYKGLILYASAFVHVQRRNPRGVLAQLRKAERHLTPYRPAYLGLDVEAILAHAAECIRHFQHEPVEWESLFPPPFAPDPRLVRGEEPELQEP